MISTLMLCSLVFKPLMPRAAVNPEDRKSCVAQIVHVDNWKNTKYVIWAFSVPSALFGYFVPYVHIVSIDFAASFRELLLNCAYIF
jgi:MCP family monocarboxylic acid transporter-like MFS transporter 10